MILIRSGMALSAFAALMQAQTTPATRGAPLRGQPLRDQGLDLASFQQVQQRSKLGLEERGEIDIIGGHLAPEDPDAYRCGGITVRTLVEFLREQATRLYASGWWPRLAPMHRPPGWHRSEVKNAQRRRPVVGGLFQPSGAACSGKALSELRQWEISTPAFGLYGTVLAVKCLIEQSPFRGRVAAGPVSKIRTS